MCEDEEDWADGGAVCGARCGGELRGLEVLCEREGVRRSGEICCGGIKQVVGAELREVLGDGCGGHL